tara:strand:- start:190 stop:786 length:597 start_codon:yes stop_codon:yes gene_type:complete
MCFTPYAIFESDGKYRYRTETYLSLTKELKKEKRCIGAIIMMNPGSSEPKEKVKEGKLTKTEPDNTMKQIEKCVVEAYGDKKPEEGYIQIFNLFNLKKPDPKEAVKIYNNNKKSPHMESPIKIKEGTPWVWLAWFCGYPELDDRRKSIYREIISKNKIVKVPCKNGKDLRFWHPKPPTSEQQTEIINKIAPQISKLII